MSSIRLQTSYSRPHSWLFCSAVPVLTALMAVVAAAGCRKIPEPETHSATPARATGEALQQPTAEQAQPQAAAPTATTAQEPAKTSSEPETIKRRPPDPGFNPLSLKDNLPICVFPNMEERVKAAYLKDVKPQKLVANSKVTFGVYGPWCINADCDDRPNLQCWTEQEGDTIIVKSRFFSFHKDGSDCKEDCLDLDTACPSQIELKAGKKYTIRHGDKSYTLQVPGMIKDPCFGAQRY